MNNNDEFEKLINSFKLEDPDDSEPKTEKKALPAGGRAPSAAGSGRPQGQTRRPGPAAGAGSSPSRASSQAPGRARKGQEFELDIPEERPLNGGEKPVRESRGEGKPAPARKVKKKKYRVFRALIIALLITGMCFYLAVFSLDVAFDLLGIDQPENEVTVDIPQGAGLSDIASILKDEGVITQPLVFRLYAKLKKAGEFQFGEYIMTAKMPYDTIFSVLEEGEDRVDIATVTVREGATLLDVANQLEELGVCEADEFIEATEEGEYNYEFIQRIGEDDPLRFYRLEGFLFPNTHQMFLGENPELVVKRFLQDFNGQMTADLYSRMNELNMTLEETITLASIIQKEAGDPAEMAAVSGVFHNRLNNPGTFPRLESDPTIFYVERVIKIQQESQNQEMYDAYNTYVCEGLPEGPICNPGLAAIEAALYPEEHDYYFFITDNEGKYYYATTMEEHEANIARADQVNAELASSSAAE
ncbi:MAG: endolytic transglycosylase MltG [Oscillospiraceae bacterium]|nr:endolytic transglycosylase MltG [Oscillospiraceae bacterium]